MKKKSSVKVKGSISKSLKKQIVTKTSHKSSSAGTKVASPPPPKPDPRYTQAVQNYEAGVRLMQSGKYDKAKAAFEKVVEGISRELADRARMHVSICNQQLERTSTSFKTPEEHYDYAIALINNADYDNARGHLEKILKSHPKADYAIYGLAVVGCLTGQTEEALRHLGQAIKLNPGNRFQARNDSDFANMSDDPRFTELIYPEPEMVSGEAG
jgi:tetratricopeptide (TPR) repeat protein